MKFDVHNYAAKLESLKERLTSAEIKKGKMIRLLLIAVLVSLPIVSSAVAAGLSARVLALTLLPPTTVKVQVAVEKGIVNAAINGNAPFVLEVTFTYQSSGISFIDPRSIQLKNTTPAGELDEHTVVREATFTLSAPPDANTPISASARIVVEP